MGEGAPGIELGFDCAIVLWLATKNKEPAKRTLVRRFFIINNGGVSTCCYVRKLIV